MITIGRPPFDVRHADHALDAESVEPDDPRAATLEHRQQIDARGPEIVQLAGDRREGGRLRIGDVHPLHAIDADALAARRS